MRFDGDNIGGMVEPQDIIASTMLKHKNSLDVDTPKYGIKHFNYDRQKDFLGNAVQFQNVTVKMGEKLVLNSFTLEVKRGSTIALNWQGGDNVLFNLIMGLEEIETQKTHTINTLKNVESISARLDEMSEDEFCSSAKLNKNERNDKSDDDDEDDSELWNKYRSGMGSPMEKKRPNKNYKKMKSFS